jgi:hypothetical protein
MRVLAMLVALLVSALAAQTRLITLIHEVLVGLFIAVLCKHGLHLVLRIRSAATDHIKTVSRRTTRVWVETVMLLSIPVGKAINRSPSDALRAANWPSRLLAATAIPVLFVPGIRATRWPTWLVIVLGVALIVAACWARALHPGAALQAASDVELAAYVVGAATLAVPYRYIPAGI